MELPFCDQEQTKTKKKYLNQLNYGHTLVDSSSHSLENNFIRFIFLQDNKTNYVKKKQKKKF